MRLLRQWMKNERFTAWIEIILGSLIAAAAYPMFITPHNIAPGGLTGVAVILNYLFHFPVGVTSLCLCVPLFLIGWRQIGLQFAFRSVAATFLFSVLIDLLPLPMITDDYLMATIFGAVLLGFGLALIMRGNATTGGTDMLAQMLHYRFPGIKVGVFLAAADGCVVLAAWFIMGARAALYALINIFICARVIDTTLAGLGNAKACYIVSDSAAKIAGRIMEDLERGATYLDATGAYSGQKKQLILCVLSGREVPQLKKILKELDPSAFLFITDTHETLGEGFATLK